MIQILGILIALAGVSVLLWALERIFPSIRTRSLRRQESAVDALYWVCSPLITRMILRAVGLACWVVLLATSDRQSVARVAEGFAPVANQPVWLMFIEVLAFGDVLGYWTHRWFHRLHLWKFHAVHHSSVQLDWLSALRMHPVNDGAARLVPVIVFACLGFPFPTLAGYIALLTFYTILLHANVDWSYGPLRYFIASPRFHRWHHTHEHEGQSKNFAPLFPFVDLLFGTFYMPGGQRPERFGTNTRVPDTFLGQLVFPFRKGDAASANNTVRSEADLVTARRLLHVRPRASGSWIEKLDTPRASKIPTELTSSRRRRNMRQSESVETV